jgi:two-component system chemotaxis response regulator CheB
MPEPVNILVVDDSAFMRKMVTELLSRDSGLRVAGQARDGADASARSRHCARTW